MKEHRPIGGDPLVWEGGVIPVADDAFRQAQGYYDRGNWRRCRELALQGLDERPDDVRFLRLAGRCSLELDLDDAAAYLRRVVTLAPDDVEAWHDLGVALVDAGQMPEAADALRQAVQLNPDDATSLVDLGHALYTLGQSEEAIAVLTRAAQRDPDDTTALRSLVEMYRGAGQLSAALDVAGQIAARQPDDVLATLDVADLNLALGNLDDAAAAYHRLRSIDPEPGHEVYAYHGMIQVEIRRQRWRRALSLAIDATRGDRYDVTTELLAFLAAQLFGEGDRPAPPWEEVDAALADEQAEHRRLHTEALVS